MQGSSSSSEEKGCTSSKELEKQLKRKNTVAEERKKALDNSRKLLKSTEDQIHLKELRINKLKSANEFKKCDDVSSELRALLKEKGQLDLQIAALERKESKSKWYKKRKSSSESQTKKVTSTPESAKNTITIVDLLEQKQDAGPSTAEHSDASADTLILDDGELPPVLQDDFHPEPDDHELNSQNLENSQRLNDPSLVLQDDCQEEVVKSVFDWQHTDDSQDFQVPPLLRQ